MAAKIDLGLQLQGENVKHLPPRAPSSNGRPLSGCFQNRGRLFTVSKQYPLSDIGTECAQKLPGHSMPQHFVQGPSSASNCLPSPVRHVRVQSAKARLETTNTQRVDDSHACDSVAVPGNDIAVYDVNMNLTLEHKPRKRRGSGKHSDPCIHNIYANRSTDRPSSAKSGWTATPVSPAIESEQTEGAAPDDLKPSVFGYRLKRQVYGCNPDIFTPCQQPAHLHTMLKLDHAPNVPTEGGSKGDHQRSGGFASRDMPSHLEPLRPWLNQTVAEEVVGVDPTACLVFLPMNQLFDDLPVLPLS